MAGEQGSGAAVSTPRPGPQPQAHLSAQLSLCVCLLGRAQALGERSGYSVSKVVFTLKCGPLQALDVGMAVELLEMSECVMGFVLPRCVQKPWDKHQCSQGRL